MNTRKETEENMKPANPEKYPSHRGSVCSSCQDKDKIIEELRKELNKWQQMCEKSVGCSPMADSFANEPHDPESFGDYVENITGQIVDLEVKLKEAMKWKREAEAKLKIAVDVFVKINLHPDVDILESEYSAIDLATIYREWIRKALKEISK